MPIVAEEESILKSVLRLLIAFGILIGIFVGMYFLTMYTNIPHKYIFAPFIIILIWVFPLLRPPASPFEREADIVKTAKWPYNKAIMKEYVFQKMRREKPRLFYTLLTVYVVVCSVLTGLIIYLFFA